MSCERIYDIIYCIFFFFTNSIPRVCNIIKAYATTSVFIFFIIRKLVSTRPSIFFDYIVIPRTVKIGIYFYDFSVAFVPLLHKSTSAINNSVINTNLFDVQQKLLLRGFFFIHHKIPRKIMSASEINKSIEVHLLSKLIDCLQPKKLVSLYLFLKYV